jgi:hypothetical protein
MVSPIGAAISRMTTGTLQATTSSSRGASSTALQLQGVLGRLTSTTYEGALTGRPRFTGVRRVTTSGWGECVLMLRLRKVAGCHPPGIPDTSARTRCSDEEHIVVVSEP